MKFSIIVPSFNQSHFIEETFKNLTSLKAELGKTNVDLEILLFDSCSADEVQNIINKYKPLFDYIEIKKDKGQYDAINKGIQKLTGDYWTWLNTDDLIDNDGCLKIANLLEQDCCIDYIYGNTMIIDDKGNFNKKYTAKQLSLNSLRNVSSTIVQPGSFYRTQFTKQIGLLKPYNCCFDYEYLLRILSNNGRILYINEIVSKFRYYATSKSGKLESIFTSEQLIISKHYKRHFFSPLTYDLYKKQFKHFLKNIFIK